MGARRAPRSPVHAAAVLLAVTALAGCGGAPPTSPAPPLGSAPPLPPFPWERASIADVEPAPEPPPRPVVIRNATLLLANGKRIARGSLVLEGGKITAVTEGEPASQPSGAEVVDASGKFVTPGIIDTHSHMGVFPLPDAGAHADGNEMTDPLTAFAQAVDAFWPQDPSLERAAAGGVTTIQVLPGSGNLIGGRAVTVKLRPAPAGRALGARELHPLGVPDGLKMACGENPKRVYGEKSRQPMTRMGNVALQRSAFLKAKKKKQEWERWREREQKRLSEHQRKLGEHEVARNVRWARRKWCEEGAFRPECSKWREELEKPSAPPAAGEAEAPPERDPGLEALIGAMEGKVLVHVHCYRADDMLAMLALADEMGFSIRSFHHALEAYKIRQTLADRGISVSTWADWWGFKLEAYDGIPENAALVFEAGGRAIIHSDSPEGVQRLNQEAAKALTSGLAAGVKLTEDDAIRWITSNPAWALGMEGRTGTLEVGKDADVVLWDKSPFSVYASAERVFVAGRETWNRAAPSPPWSDFELGQPAQGAK